MGITTRFSENRTLSQTASTALAFPLLSVVDGYTSPPSSALYSPSAHVSAIVGYFTLRLSSTLPHVSAVHGYIIHSLVSVLLFPQYRASLPQVSAIDGYTNPVSAQIILLLYTPSRFCRDWLRHGQFQFSFFRATSLPSLNFLP